MKNLISKILTILSSVFEFIKDYQLLKAGRDSLKKQILEEELKKSSQIEEIKKTVDDLSNDDLSKLLDIKITDNKSNM